MRLPTTPKNGWLLRGTIAAYRSGAKSITQDAIAVGYTPAQAARLAAATPDSTILSTPCVTVYAESQKLYGRVCDVQELAQNKGGGNWILSDEITGSGGGLDNDISLYSFAGYVAYGNGNSVVKWAPNSTVSVGSCRAAATLPRPLAGTA